MRINFFSYRVVEMGNSLPDCISFESLSDFKCTISAVDFTGFLKRVYCFVFCVLCFILLRGRLRVLLVKSLAVRLILFPV